MTTRRAPRLALALLRRCGGRYSESLEGDLLEEFAAGRSVFWCWREVSCLLVQRARVVISQRLTLFVVATVFFLFALWAIAPATASVMGWANAVKPLDVVVQLGWLSGVPFLLGTLAGAANRSRGTGAVVLGAALAYATPITSPFEFAVCDLCVGPGSTVIPDAVQWLTTLGSALLAGLGAYAGAGFVRLRQESAA